VEDKPNSLKIASTLNLNSGFALVLIMAELTIGKYYPNHNRITMMEK
jgi:hypothetical protein